MTDPVVRNARREAIVIGLVWVASTLWCCFYSRAFGYSTPEHPLDARDIRPIFGIPSWAFWGYIVPWGACAAFSVWFAGLVMTDDDLGADHSTDLEREIRGKADDA